MSRRNHKNFTVSPALVMDIVKRDARRAPVIFQTKLNEYKGAIIPLSKEAFSFYWNNLRTTTTAGR